MVGNVKGNRDRAPIGPTSTDPDMFGMPDRLIVIRKYRGLNRSEACLLCTGKKGSLWSHWELGEAIPSLRAIAQIAKGLGVSIDWLVLGRGEMVVGDDRAELNV